MISIRLGFLLLLVLAMFLSIGTPSVFAFRCEGKLVANGDSKFEILSKCGEPTWIEKRTAERIETAHDDSESYSGHYRRSERLIVPVDIEEWTYNLGPGRLIQILTFENGKLVKVDTGGYGY